MREEIEQLRQSAARQQQTPGTSYAEQVALLEKSYELAARYMPNPDNSNIKHEDEEKPDNGRKAKAEPVGRVSVPVVSSLAQPVSDSVMLARLSEPRNFGFNTAVGGTSSHGRNTISVCVHGDQTVISGQSVRLRLLEPMRVGRHELPRNSLITGDCRIQGERMDITISQVEYSGNIIPVELAVYDNDGQPGIFIPGSMERTPRGRWRPTWGRTSAPPYLSPASPPGTSSCRNSARERFREYPSISPKRCVRRRCG